MIWSKATTNLVERLDNFAKRMKMVPPQVDWDDIPTLREAAIELTRLRAIEKAARGVLPHAESAASILVFETRPQRHDWWVEFMDERLPVLRAVLEETR